MAFFDLNLGRHLDLIVPIRAERDFQPFKVSACQTFGCMPLAKPVYQANFKTVALLQKWIANVRSAMRCCAPKRATVCIVFSGKSRREGYR